MKEYSHYVVAWVIAGRRLFLLWRDGEAEPDTYAVGSGGSSLLNAKSIKQIVELGREHGLKTNGQLAQTVDFDGTLVILKRLRTARPLSQRSAGLLLDAWNALEDVSRSIGISLLAREPASKAITDQLYEKIFFGNNLPAMTPKGREYRPLLTSEEQALLKHMFRTAIGELATAIA